jgi:hypothetical protein
VCRLPLSCNLFVFIAPAGLACWRLFPDARLRDDQSQIRTAVLHPRALPARPLCGIMEYWDILSGNPIFLLSV